MKSDYHYVLEAAIAGVTEHVEALKQEIGNLDPSATYELKMITARLEGVKDYMSIRVEDLSNVGS